ncbi:MAG: conjugal transfer protein TraR [Firmicutes bacterium]|jgi:YteA family regulatory protein|nr:conjugal transfer protein TraR [Bacillota bacterium]
MGDGFFGDLRERLQAEKTELEKTLDSLNDGLRQRLTESVAELSAYDQHTADLGAETFERGKDLGLRDNTEHLLADTNAALELMDRGEYGICQDCGSPIDDERLRAIPSTTMCFECKNAQESVRDEFRRPIEEKVIPFELTEPDTVGFDAEDTWQAVARWGTANTPQDVPGAHDYSDTYINANEDIGVVTPLEALESEGILTTNWDEVYPSPKRRSRGDILEEP